MTKNKIYNTTIFLFCLVLTVIFFTSCHVDNDWEEQSGNGVTGAYMKIKLSMPGFDEPATTTAGKTRAMDEKAENRITPQQLRILVFKTNTDNPDAAKYHYTAPVSSIQPDEDNHALSTVTVKLIRSATPAEQFDFVVIANHDLSGLSLEKDVTTKRDIRKQLTYSMPGDDGKEKWNADKDNYIPFPMWGELGGKEVIEGMESPKINMYRALARIDVGLAFNFESADHEEAGGIANFKIKEMKVYRTNNKGYVAPLFHSPLPGEENYLPHIPDDTDKLADDSPLSFTITEPQEGSDRYIREIYVPESKLPDDTSDNNMHCVVVGGYYAGSSQISYYRLNFAKKDGKDSEYEYLPIYRNHRYVFNILEVKGPGFSTVEAALKSSPNEELEYELITWDESIHEMHVQGKYYFGLDNRELTLEARSTVNAPENLAKIKYQTNYPLSSSDPVTFEWEKNADTPFHAEWDEIKKIIKITAKNDNETNTILTDVLHVKAGTFVINVVVNQRYVNFKYTIDCASVMVHGTYEIGKPLNASHYITLDITAEDASINGSTFEIYVEQAENNNTHGISFRATGTFNVTSDNLTMKGIKLIGSGTLDRNVSEPFSVIINSNSSSGAYCEATITPVIAKLTILTMANNSNYGYKIGKPGTGSYKVITHPNNFGPNDNSIVKIEGLELVNVAPNIPTWTRLFNEGKVLELLGHKKTTQLADILCIGYNDLEEMSDEQVGYIVNYMKKGGVVIFCNERIGIAKCLIKQLFGVDAKDADLPEKVHVNTVPFVGNEVFKTGELADDEKWNKYLFELQSDPILNGPFGDIKEKQWGEDASYARAIKTTYITNSTNPGDIMIYSYGRSLGQAQADKKNNKTNKDFVTFFKYETDKDDEEPISLVYIGDGGIMSSALSGKPYPESGYTLCPFWWDESTMFPIPKPNYGSLLLPNWEDGVGVKADVYNSQMFCNILAWAINRSIALQDKRDAAINN